MLIRLRDLHSLKMPRDAGRSMTTTLSAMFRVTLATSEGDEGFALVSATSEGDEGVALVSATSEGNEEDMFGKKCWWMRWQLRVRLNVFDVFRFP